jgi:flagellar assembly factor FliW
MPSHVRLEEPMTAQSGTAPESDIPPVLNFVTPMPGFPEHRDFCLVRIGEQELLYSLTSIADPELRFLVIPPGGFFPDYMPEVDDETLDLLGSRAADDLLVLLVVTPGGTAREATANLLAPIIIDQPHRRAVQAVLAGSGLPVRAPIMAGV